MLPARKALHPISLRPLRQRGFGIYILVLILGAVATVTVVSMMTSSTLKTREQTTHAQILAESKLALIGWATTRGSTTNPGLDRPGDLPAPDITRSSETPANNYNGDRNNTGCLSVLDGTSLVSYDRNARCLGRLPWRDLKMALQAPSEQDAEGRMPWYAVSANLTRIDVCFGKLNSETVNLAYNGFPADCTASPPTSPAAPNPPYPWLTVRDGRGNVISNRVAFVVMVPGAVVGSQQRPASPLGAANQYLDSMTVAAGCAAPCVPGTYSNADLDNDFIAGDSSATFNDKLLYVTIDDLMAAVENQVAAYIAKVLKTEITIQNAAPIPAPKTSWLAAFNPGVNSYKSAIVGNARGMLPDEHVDGGNFTTGFQWAMSSTAPVTRSGTVNSSEVRSNSVPAGQGSCTWTPITTAIIPTYTNYLQRVQCTGTRNNPETGVTRRVVSLAYNGSAAPSTIPVDSNYASANLVISPATSTTTLSRSVNRGTLNSVTLQITDYDDNSTTWSWNPWLGAWVYGPEIVGYGTENAGSGYSIRTWGISYFPPLSFANWYTANEWWRFIYIAIAPGYQPGGANSCAAANSCFSVRNNGNTAQTSLAGVVLSAGRALSALSQTRHNTTLGNYFEGGNDAASSTLIFDRQTPISDSFNDQVIAITP
jgi:hypothetical protein